MKLEDDEFESIVTASKLIGYKFSDQQEEKHVFNYNFKKEKRSINIDIIDIGKNDKNFCIIAECRNIDFFDYFDVEWNNRRGLYKKLIGWLV